MLASSYFEMLYGFTRVNTILDIVVEVTETGFEPMTT